MLREGHRQRVFENGVVRKIFRPKREEVTGQWRRLPNEELNDLYSSPNIIRVIEYRRMRWARHLARMGSRRDANRVLVGRPERQRQPRNPRRRCENIKMDAHAVGWTGLDWINLDEDRDR